MYRIYILKDKIRWDLFRGSEKLLEMGEEQKRARGSEYDEVCNMQM
jgi:hypothetical protein